MKKLMFAFVVGLGFSASASATDRGNGFISMTDSTLATAGQGSTVKDATYAGDGGVDLYVSADSTWTVTASCALQSLTVASGARIVDGSGKAVSIVNAAQETIVPGASDLTVAVSAYATGNVVAPHEITDFEIDRSAFAATYEKEQGHEGGTYYFKPHAPTNAIVKVKVAGSAEYGTPDRDHKYWLDAYWVANTGVTVRILYVADTGYLFADGSVSNSWELAVSTNKMEVWPPAGCEAIKGRVSSGKNYYLTLQAAVDAAKARQRLRLLEDVTLAETLTVTNAITLDLNANAVTLDGSLTNAFRFTAGATVSNGTIRSTLAANAENSVLMRFTDCKATLHDLTVSGRGYEFVVAHDSEMSATEKYASGHVDDTLTCDGLVLTGNGCLLSVDHAKATLAANCSFTADDAFASFGGAREAAVSCSGNGTVTIAGGTYASPKVLQSGDFGGRIVVNGGTFSGLIYSLMARGAHADLEGCDRYKAQFALNTGTYTDASLAFADAGSRSLDEFTKADEVVLAAPTGYVWRDSTLVCGTPPDPVAAGVTSEPYADALSATNAAAAVNANKANSIVVPTGVEGSAKTLYLTKVAAAATSDNRVVVGLTPAAAAAEQAAVDAAVTSAAVAASLAGADASAKATLATTTPGLYYWIAGGTEVGAVTQPGPAELSTTGGAVELSKPALDAKKGRAFFRVAAGVAAPARSNGD